MATLGMSEADREAIETFKQDVIEPSMTKIIILDFWAEWCGPCKQLTPVLEKVAATYADRGVMLAKINVDEQKMLAAQFRVQSIPTVYAVFKGQIVADLTQFRTEPQVARALDQLLKQYPVEGEAQSLAAEIEPMIAMGEDILTSGDGLQAIAIFQQVLELSPDHPAALSGLIRALIAAEEIEAASEIAVGLPEAVAKDVSLAQALSALELAQNAQPVDDLSGLLAKVAAEPDNHALRFELANGQMASGDRDSAAESLLHIIAADRAWEDGKARAQLLKIFEAIGLEDPWVSATRRRLSAVLFG